MKKANNTERNQRRQSAVDSSRSGKLADMFLRESHLIKPDAISDEAWALIQKAEELAGHFELKNLEQLILKYVDAVKRAKGCGCFQCNKRARIITQLLDDELERLRHDLTKENQDLQVERQIIEADTAFAIQKLKKAKEKEMRAQFKKREKEWLKRTKRIRQLIAKVVQHNSEPNKGLTEEERREIQELLAQARERRNDWAWKKW